MFALDVVRWCRFFVVGLLMMASSEYVWVVTVVGFGCFVVVVVVKVQFMHAIQNIMAYMYATWVNERMDIHSYLLSEIDGLWMCVCVCVSIWMRGECVYIWIILCVCVCIYAYSTVKRNFRVSVEQLLCL